MKRYIVSYSKNILIIRDRKTNQTFRKTFVDRDIANVFEEAVKTSQATLRQIKSSKAETVDDTKFLIKTFKQFKPDYGWMQPTEIKWASEDKQENITDKRVIELNKILNL